MSALPFQPVRCFVAMNVERYPSRRALVLDDVGLPMLSAHDAFDLDPAVLIPAALYEAMGRFVAAQRVVTAMEDTCCGEPYDPAFDEHGEAIEALLTLWPEVTPNG